MAKDNRPWVKDEEQYEALRDQGYSKEKSARIANADNSGKKGGKANKYGDRTKDELYEKAQEVGIAGRSQMTKDELIQALRNH
ncbi:MAG: Rho termination factor N-terminal domain-containing protein [Leeuwenhoekiella sp.]